MKVMVDVLPNGCCPSCGHMKFVVSEIQHNIFLTNRDGEIIDSKEMSYNATGQCVNCGKVYDMEPTYNGFIPMTPLRKLLYEHTPHYLPRILDNKSLGDDIKNPMEKED